MAGEHILIIEDEEDILELVTYTLRRAGYTVSGVLNGEDGMVRLRQSPPDLILLDLMLPGIGGLEVCRQLRQGSVETWIPLIMITALGEEDDIIAGLELGADDYVAKPFSPKVLIARIGSVLRRRLSPLAAPDDRPLHRGPIILDPIRYEVTVNEAAITLTAAEFRLLHYLARRPGWVFTRDQIITAIHDDENHPVTDRSVDVLVVGLRKKLTTAGGMIETVRGVGYRFQESP